MKKILFAALLALALPFSAFAQSPPADCSLYGFCAGLGAPTGNCKPGQNYTQIDSPGKMFSCSGIPPVWTALAGGATPAPPNYAVQFNLSNALGADSTFTFNPTHKVLAVPQLILSNGFEDEGSGVFSDLGTSHDGGVAAPTDGSVAHAVQQTLDDAECWSLAHGNAPVKVYISDLYPISTSTSFLGHANEEIDCTVIMDKSYTSACLATNTNLGNNTATGGTPLFSLVYTNPVTCNGTTVYPGVEGATLNGFHIAGGGFTAGGADVGVLVQSDNVTVKNIEITGFFGGPGIQVKGPGTVNVTLEWNYGTNVDGWWGANGSSILTENGAPIGAIDFSATDSFLLFNQYSSGYGFARGFVVGDEYPNLCVANINGAGNYIMGNLFQTDEIGICAQGQENRISMNRSEYMARELIRDNSYANRYTSNMLTSGCLDSSLPTTALTGCYGVVSNDVGIDMIGNTVEVEAAVDGPSHYQGSYFLYGAATAASLQTNRCNTDAPGDAYGNGQCWWIGANDYFGNGGPAGMPNNGQSRTATCSSGTIWVGDYKTIYLNDTTPGICEPSFQGMSIGQTFYLSPTTVQLSLVPTGTEGYYGHPGSTTCDGYPLVMEPGQSYAFTYTNNGPSISQQACQNASPTYLALNHYGQTDPGPMSTAALDAFGNIAARLVATPPAPTIGNAGGPAIGSETDTYIVEVYAGGAHFTTPVGSLSIASANLATYPLTITPNLPNGWLEDLVYRVSATQSGLTAGLIGTCIRSTGCSGIFTDIGQTPSLTTIPAASINTSGRISFGLNSPPTVGNACLNPGEVTLGTDNNFYICNSSLVTVKLLSNACLTTGCTFTGSINNTTAGDIVNFPSYQAGANSSISGAYNGKNNTTILAARNAANTADLPLISVDPLNELLIGLSQSFTSTISDVQIGAPTYIESAFGVGQYIPLTTTQTITGPLTSTAYPVSAASGAITITLDATPTDSAQLVIFQKASTDTTTNGVTITFPINNGLTTQSVTLTQPNQTLTLIGNYPGSGWNILANSASCPTAGCTSTGLNTSTTGFATLGTQNISGCSLSSQIGSALSGSFTAGATSCSVTITFPFAASHGWFCSMQDNVSGAMFRRVSDTTTSTTYYGTVTSGDGVAYACTTY